MFTRTRPSAMVRFRPPSKLHANSGLKARSGSGAVGIESAALETSRRGDVDERVAGHLHLDADLWRPGLIGGVVNVVVERRGIGEDLPSQAGTPHRCCRGPFARPCTGRRPSATRGVTGHTWPGRTAPAPSFQSSRTADLNRWIHRDFDLPFVVVVEEEHATDPRELRCPLHERQLLRDLTLDVRHVGCLQLQLGGIGVDEEPIVRSPIRRQAGQRRGAVQSDGQLRRRPLLDVLP